MSKNIIIGKCRSCNREIGRKEEGEYKNPNGIIAVNTRIFTVDKSLCPYCKKKEK